MARRKLAATTRLDEIAEAFNLAADQLARESCEHCGQRTLEVDITLRSGVRISCGGLDPHTDDGYCSYQKFAILSGDRDLPRTDIVGEVDPA